MSTDDPMHNHRREGDSDDMTGHRMQAIADSTFAKSLVRFGVPIMLTVIGWLGIDRLSDIKSAQDEQRKVQLRQAADIAQIKSDVRDVNTRFDVQAIRELSTTTTRVDKLEDRVSTLERVVKTP